MKEHPCISKSVFFNAYVSDSCKMFVYLGLFLQVVKHCIWNSLSLMGPTDKMANEEKIKVVQTPPREPISLRIVYTEQHQWMRVSSHILQCPGNGCSVEMCLYIRQLIAHHMEDCDPGCKWCCKIISWLKYHKKDCGPKKCPYYHICSEVQKRALKVSMRRHSDSIKLTSTTALLSPETVTFDERGLMKDAPDIDDDACCRDPRGVTEFDDNQLLKGAFTDIYEKALSEKLPESEHQIRNIIDVKSSMRQALICQLRENRGYQEGRHWRRVRQIGRGGSGKAFCIEDVESEVCLAMKEEPESDNAVHETYISLFVSSASKDHPPNIVEFYAAALLPPSEQSPREHVQLFLELMPCCMQSYLYSTGPLSVEDCHNYACQLFDALEFLHQKINIVHADIKPGNLLIDENLQRVKVADFGCSQILEDYHQGYCMKGDPKAGTVHYNPPEHYVEGRCGYSLDMWQAGCCLIAMVTGRRPWRALYPDCKDERYEMRRSFLQYQQLQIWEACDAGHTHSIPGFLDKAMTHLICRCLDPDYRKRLSPMECLSLLVQSDVVLEKNRDRWLSQIGVSPSTLPELYRSTSSSHSQIVDVYLGSYYQSLYPVHACLQPGWLGSIPCDSDTIYEQFYRQIQNHIPIVQRFPRYEIRICENEPCQIWKKSRVKDKTEIQSLTSEPILNLQIPSKSDKVDPSIAVVLILPYE